MRLSFKLTIATAFLILVSTIVGVHWTWDWVPGLIAKLRDPGISERSKVGAIYRLVRIGDARAVEPITELLVGPQRLCDGDDRRVAVMALGMLGDSRAFEPLLGICQDTKEELWVRLEALRAIGHVRHPRSFEVVRRALDDPSDLKPSEEHAWQFPKAAVWGLAGIGSSKSIDILKSLMVAGHRTPDNVAVEWWQVARALVSTHDPGAIDAVISECERESDRVVVRLVGHAFLVSPDPWAYSQFKSRILDRHAVSYDELARSFHRRWEAAMHFEEYTFGKPAASLNDRAFARALRAEEEADWEE